MGISKILVRTELDMLSAGITEFAADLACQMGVKEIILLNIIIPANTQAFMATEDVFHANEDLSVKMNEALLEKHNQMIHAEIKKYAGWPVSIKPYVTFSDSKTDLNRFMEEFDAGLLVCASKDQNSFFETLLGSRPEKLARRVDHPIIIIKHDDQINPISDIAVAIDVENKNQEGLGSIIEFAGQIKAKLSLLHVITSEDHSPEDAIEKLNALAKKNNMNDYSIHIVNDHSLENGLHKFIRKYNPDMIAVLSEGKGKLKTLIYGSGAQDIIKETDKPVLLSKIH